MSSYVLITAARNEEAYIEKTIQSVIAQTVLPTRWIIVSDGSTDRTEEIVQQYRGEHSYIELLCAANDVNRNFGSKAKAVQAGYARIKHLEFEYVGNLDADVSFGQDYYKNILSEFHQNSKLGIAGGIRYDFCNGKFKRVKNSRNSVGGPFQLFRRKCFEDIGGYKPLEYGGIDAVAEITTRMHGWEVESFPEYTVYHHRCTGTANRSAWSASFRAGIRDYLVGYHPLFQVVRSVYRSFDTTSSVLKNVVQNVIRLSGYFWAALRGYERPVSDNFVKYLQSEQLARLRHLHSKKTFEANAET